MILLCYSFEIHIYIYIYNAKTEFSEFRFNNKVEGNWSVYKMEKIKYLV